MAPTAVVNAYWLKSIERAHPGALTIGGFNAHKEARTKFRVIEGLLMVLSDSVLFQDTKGLHIDGGALRRTAMSERGALAVRVLAEIFAAPHDDAAPVAAPPPAEDRLLTTEEMAPMLGLTPHELRRRSKNFPFRRKHGHRTIRYSLNGFRRWSKRAEA